jgi:hypothetical protein
MRDVEEYLRQAAECERLAKTALTEQQAKAIHEIAEVWRKLAAEREQGLKAQPAPTNPKNPPSHPT